MHLAHQGRLRQIQFLETRPTAGVGVKRGPQLRCQHRTHGTPSATRELRLSECKRKAECTRRELRGIPRSALAALPCGKRVRPSRTGIGELNLPPVFARPARLASKRSSSAISSLQPGWRDLLHSEVHDFAGKVPDAVEPRLEILPSPHACIHVGTEIHSLHRRIRQAPVRPIKHKAKAWSTICARNPDALRIRRGSEEDSLARIAVRGPFVEHQHARELPHVFHLIEKRVGEKIVNRRARRIAGKSGTEVPTEGGCAAFAAKLEIDIRVQLQKLLGDPHHGHFRGRQTEMAQEDGRNPFNFGKMRRCCGLLPDLTTMQELAVGGLRAGAPALRRASFAPDHAHRRAFVEVTLKII